MPSMGERGAGDVRSVLAPKEGILTLGTQLEVSMAPHSSRAGSSTQALLVGVLAQRSDVLREEGPTNADAYSHQSTFPHLLSSNLPL